MKLTSAWTSWPENNRNHVKNRKEKEEKRKGKEIKIRPRKNEEKVDYAKEKKKKT